MAEAFSVNNCFENIKCYKMSVPTGVQARALLDLVSVVTTASSGYERKRRFDTSFGVPELVELYVWLYDSELECIKNAAESHGIGVKIQHVTFAEETKI